MITCKSLSSWFLTPMLAVMLAAATGCGHRDDGDEDSGGSPAADTTSPTVLSTFPADNATDVAGNSSISVRFSEAMLASTINATTITLTGPGATPVAGSVNYDATNHVASFVPTAALAFSTEFTGAVSVAAKDLSGNALESAYTWAFTTGTTSDTEAPTVTFVSPADQSTDIPIDQMVTAQFSEQMETTSINTTTFTLMAGGVTPVAGALTYDGTTATFAPSANLAANTGFTATISTGATDSAGNPLAAAETWTFTTGATTDTTSPTVVSTSPADLATDVPVNQIVSASFSEPMDTTTITSLSFTLSQGAVAVSGVVTASGTTATFTPTNDLVSTTTYTAKIAATVTDLAGNALASEAEWTFTTGTATAMGPAPVILGTAGAFVILAKAAVTTTGTTSVVGDIGLSPAAGSYYTGFGEALHASNVYSTSSLVTGKMYAADYAVPTPANLTTAVLDMQNAFTDAANRTLPTATELGAGNIDGMTLAPGLYKWGTGLNIPSNVTLSGATNDVWIFQIGEDLTVGNGAIITLSGGAQAKNVFWQVSGQAVLGTTADFKGNVLCQTQIVMNTGAVVLGRMLAQTAITVDANTVTAP